MRRIVYAAAAAAMAYASAPAMSLSYEAIPFDNGKCQPDCPSIIVARGPIVAEEVENLKWFIERAAKGKKLARVFMIDSPGGNAVGGLNLGGYLRQNGATVIVGRVSGSAITHNGGVSAGFCGSACVFALAGGARRVVPPGSQVAVHGSRPAHTEVHDRMKDIVETIQIDRAEVTEAFAEYFATMGVNPDLARLSEGLAAESVRLLTPEELARFNLAQSTF
jgi:hypothetical protein